MTCTENRIMDIGLVACIVYDINVPAVPPFFVSIQSTPFFSTLFVLIDLTWTCNYFRENNYVNRRLANEKYIYLNIHGPQ